MAVPCFAAEPVANNAVTQTPVIITNAPSTRIMTTIVSGKASLTLGTSKSLYYVSNNTKYGTIQCFNDGDENKKGSVRFTVNGQVQDVAAGAGAQFTVSKNQQLTVTMETLWYTGEFNYRVRGD